MIYRIITLTVSFFFFSFAFAQPNLNMSLVGQLDYPQTLNDVWGYAAPDGTEYALVGTTTGVSIVSLADPADPQELFFIPGANSTWRDIKTWESFAYVTNETGGGVAVIDLSGLPDAIDSYNWQPTLPGLGILNSCHNIFIDEFGYAYLSGCNMNGGGVLFIDVFTSPGNPEYVGKGPATYSHDAYARDNRLYSADISAGFFSIHDVTDKENSVLLATQNTPSLATHNCWLSDDGSVLFTTDETGDAPVAAYDITDPDNIIELDQFRPFFNLNMGAIPHNAFVWDDFLIVSYYTEGCIVIDGSRPENLIQVGNFDTFLGGAGGFSGAWGAYPYLPSGLVLVSDQSDGLFVLEPNYVRACYLEGSVTDADTGDPVLGARVRFTDELPFADSDIAGDYQTGFATAGAYTLEASKLGYESVEATVELENGELTIQDFELQALPSFIVTGTVLDLDTGEPVADAQVKVQSPEITFNSVTNANGNFQLDAVFAGTYDIVAGKWGYRTEVAGTEDLSENNNSFTIELETGIEDIFLLDLGWTVQGSAQQGQFELATPPLHVVATPPGGPTLDVQPGEDSEMDEGNGCYITSNISDVFGGVLIGGSTRLTSPVFDVTGMNEPRFSFESWFFNINTNGTGTGNDAITVRISNGNQTKILAQITDVSLFDEQLWVLSEYDIAEELEPTATMQVSFEVNDNDFVDASEAAIDHFQVWDANPTSTREIDASAFNMQVFPNPSTNAFTISYDVLEWDGNARLTVFNLLGQALESLQLEGPSGQVQIGHQLEKGLYFVQLQQEGKQSMAIKLVKN